MEITKPIFNTNLSNITKIKKPIISCNEPGFSYLRQWQKEAFDKLRLEK